MVLCYADGPIRCACMHYELNDRDLATEILLQSMVGGLQEELIDEMVPAFLLLSKIRLSLGDACGALSLLDEAEKKASLAQNQSWQQVIKAARIRVCIATGATPSIVQWLHADAPDPYGKITEEKEYEFITLARAYYFNQQFSDALLILKRLTSFSEQISRNIEILNLLALVYLARLDNDKALAYIEDSLKLGIETGFVRSYVDEGEPMATLLQKYLRVGAKAGPTAELLPYVRTLLRGLRDDCLSRNWNCTKESNSSTPALTRRETEILQLLAQNLTNATIATKLSLTINTVKVHNRNLFYKLKVRNRTMAVEMARKMGLI